MTQLCLARATEQQMAAISSENEWESDNGGFNDDVEQLQGQIHFLETRLYETESRCHQIESMVR